MGKSAFVLGGSGFIGRHVARRLAQAGWQLSIGSRGETPIPHHVAHLRHATVDRSSDESVTAAIGDGVDVFVDVIPYEPKDAEQLLRLKDGVGSIVAISSAAVYADEQGRSLESARAGDFPNLPVPIAETRRTVEASADGYAAGKVGVERTLLDQDELPATVIRPAAVYGPGDTQCREWFFVKRALDRRPHVLLAYEGKSVFHTTSVHNLAELVRVAADNPGTRILNSGDPDPPDVLRIARSIAQAVGHDWTEVLVPPQLSNESFVRNPWATPRPFILDMRKAKDDLGYEPVTTYDDAIVETVDWVVKATRGRDWKQVLPRTAEYLAERFDYEAEDAFVNRVTG